MFQFVGSNPIIHKLGTDAQPIRLFHILLILIPERNDIEPVLCVEKVSSQGSVFVCSVSVAL